MTTVEFLVVAVKYNVQNLSSLGRSARKSLTHLPTPEVLRSHQRRLRVHIMERHEISYARHECHTKIWLLGRDVISKWHGDLA